VPRRPYEELELAIVVGIARARQRVAEVLGRRCALHGEVEIAGAIPHVHAAGRACSARASGIRLGSTCRDATAAIFSSPTITASARIAA